MDSNFLTIARQGRSNWKHYLMGVSLVFAISLIIWLPVFFITIHVLDISINNREIRNLLLYGNPFRTLALYGVVSTALILSLFLAVKRVHKRKYLTLFSPDASVCWRRIIKGFSIWLSLYGVSFLVWYLVNPSRYILKFNALEWLPFSLFALAVAPIISSVGILFLYAYLLQGVGLLIRHPFLLSIVWGLILGSLFNDANMPSDWFLNVTSSMFITWVIIKDNRLELIIGLSTANYLVTLLIVRSHDSTFKMPTIFELAEPAPFLPLLITYMLKFGLFYYICFGIRKNLSASTPE